MSDFTLIYGLRLLPWSLGLALFCSAVIFLSWIAWRGVGGSHDPQARNRIAILHFVALVTSPALVAIAMHIHFSAMGAEIVREPPNRDALLIVDAAHWAVAPAILAAIWGVGIIAVLYRVWRGKAALAAMRCTPAPVGLSLMVERLSTSWPNLPAFRIYTADVPGPMVVGAREPALILPSDFQTGFARDEIDAIILHELAHIARRDFEQNVHQRYALALAWFNPFAWALYHHAAQEREMCCDALAVRMGASTAALARALLRIAGDEKSMAIAMAASHRGDLAIRLGGLLARHPAREDRSRSFVASACLSLLLGSAVWAAHPRFVDPALLDLYIASAFGPTVKVGARDPAGTFELRIKQGDVVRAWVENRPIPATDIVQRGASVTLIGPARRPVAHLKVSPTGRIKWDARPRPSH